MRAKFTLFALFAFALAFLADAGEAPCPTRSFHKTLGRYSAFASGRISGGQNTAPNEFPWQAYIQVTFWSGDTAICGGSLISDEWVISAAHCAYGATNITVTLGAYDTSLGSADNYRQVFTVSPRNVKTYPSWYFPDLEGDLVLIPLPSKADFNDYVSPISLPYVNEETSFENNFVILTGWGNFSSTPESGLSPKLQKTATTVLRSLGVNPDCQREAEQSFDGDRIICGDGKDSRRFCYGDDGGPMNYYRADEEDWVLVGVATSGDSSPNCASSVKPSLYTRVSYYLDWIHNNTQIPPRVRTTTTSTSTTTPRTTTTRLTTTGRTAGPYDYICNGNPNGDYPYPGEVCTKYFISCSNGIAYLMECAILGTVFDVTKCYCDYPNNVAECANTSGNPSAWLRFEKS